MADALPTVKIDGRTFAIDADSMSLGDHRLLKIHFGLDLGEVLTDVKTPEGFTVQTFNFEDPNVLVALLAISLHQQQPSRDFASIVAEVDALGLDGFDISYPEPEVEEGADPQSGGQEDDDSEATAAPSKPKNGNSAKRPKKRGGQS